MDNSSPRVKGAFFSNIGDINSIEAGTVHAHDGYNVMDQQFRTLVHKYEMSCVWFLGAAICLLLYGCAAFDTDESVRINESSALKPDDEGEKNLAAVRALLSEERQRATFPSDASGRRNPESTARPWPPGWLASYFSPESSTGQKSNLTSVHVPPSSTSLSKRREAPLNPMVKIPRVTDPSSRLPDVDPWPRVPAYMSPAPIGSAYPGSIRCVPDLLGGQRCQVE
jgi:hypothetical protein